MSGIHSAESVFAVVSCKTGKTLRRNTRGRNKKKQKKGAGNAAAATNLAEMIVDRAQQAAPKVEPRSDEGGDDDVMELSRRLIDLHQKSKELAQINKMLLEQLSVLLKTASS